MSRLTLRNIEIFIAAIEEGSVAAAARRLSTSPSSISQHLSNLEEDLGTTLIDRTKRPLALTPAGVLFRRRAANILNEATRARAELAAADYTTLTHLSLAVIDDFEPDVTPALMASLAAEMPDCHIVLQTGASHANLAALESRSVDMCIAAEPDRPESWMEIYPLLNEPFVLLAPTGIVNPSKPALPQLLSKPFIRFPRSQVVGRMIEARLTAEHITLPQKFEIDSYQSIMAMVAQGTGWAITPPMCYLRAQRFQPDVDILPLPFEGLARRISLFARKDTLDKMPSGIAARLTTLIDDALIKPTTASHPWLKDGFRRLTGLTP
ncbi:MAG TPA: LysR family transcriptional regulator [Rhodobacteraceae bacterium]|nr:LysR family transcriptional regulator [Paracoccaceae bacterium]